MATGSPRAACTLRDGDIVQIDGVQRIVDTTISDFSSPAAPRVIVRFKDGGSRRLHAGYQFQVERPE
jgi:hypothetical protein